jgi:hypothetical protein
VASVSSPALMALGSASSAVQRHSATHMHAAVSESEATEDDEQIGGFCVRRRGDDVMGSTWAQLHTTAQARATGDLSF